MYDYDVNKTGRVIEIFIFDIFIAIKKIEHTIKDFKNGEELLYSFAHWDSAIREFEIIDEATNYLMKYGLVDGGYRKMVDFRNKIAHKYFGLNAQKAYEIAKFNLDDVEFTVKELIEDIEPTLKQELIDSFIEDNYYLDFVVKALNELL